MLTSFCLCDREVHELLILGYFVVPLISNGIQSRSLFFFNESDIPVIHININ